MTTPCAMELSHPLFIAIPSSAGPSLPTVLALSSELSDADKEIFQLNFISYLKHDQHNDFVVDFDDAWKWLGFSRKDPAKRLLTQSFVEDRDYRISLHPKVERSLLPKEERGGQNKETILLTPFAFKEFSLLARTARGRSVRLYYLHLEGVFNKQIKLDLDQYKSEQHAMKMLMDAKNVEMATQQEAHRIDAKKTMHDALMHANEGFYGLYLTSATAECREVGWNRSPNTHSAVLKLDARGNVVGVIDSQDAFAHRVAKKSAQHMCVEFTRCFNDGMRGVMPGDGYAYMRQKDHATMLRCQRE